MKLNIWAWFTWEYCRYLLHTYMYVHIYFHGDHKLLGKGSYGNRGGYRDCLQSPKKKENVWERLLPRYINAKLLLARVRPGQVVKIMGRLIVPPQAVTRLGTYGSSYVLISTCGEGKREQRKPRWALQPCHLHRPLQCFWLTQPGLSLVLQRTA